jgi:hypothetical protein
MLGAPAAAQASRVITQISERAHFDSEQFLLGTIMGLVVALIIVAALRRR